jgi:hypothetical protein
VAFNTAERWAEDASEDIAREISAGSILPVMKCHHRTRDSWSGI